MAVVVSDVPSYVELKLDRRMYQPGDLVTGTITIICSKPKKFDSIRISLEGKTELDVSPSSVGLFDSFYSPVEPINWISRFYDVAKNGIFSIGRNPFTFELALAPTSSRQLIETLKGNCIRTNYIVTVNVYRGFTSRTLTTECEVQVQVPDRINKSIISSSPNQFKFSDLIIGEIQGICQLGGSISGHIMIMKKNIDIATMEIELVRVEDIFWGEDEAIRETCQVQTIEIVDGKLPAGTLVPFFFLIPRLVVCPSYYFPEFEVSYFVNIHLVLLNEQVFTQQVPITFNRC